MNILFVGPLGGGKTTLANRLVEMGFCKESNYHSIEKYRRSVGNGHHSGEFLAWSQLLLAIESPAENDNNIYEFSGTGRNVWNVTEAMNLSKGRGQDWLIVYCLAESSVLESRASKIVYDAPCPFQMDNINSSIDYMNKELKKSFTDINSWNGTRKTIIRTDIRDIENSVTNILEYIKQAYGDKK